VGIGAFVYLRRVFEHLIEEAHVRATAGDGWNEGAYLEGRVVERIAFLKNELPIFLVENKSLYGILSKGVHELSEQECLGAFDVVTLGIELILDDELRAKERRAKIDLAKRSITQLASRMGSKPGK